MIVTKTKQLWILAGGNGAGKSTFYRQRLQSEGVEFVNADLIEKKLNLPASEKPSYQAATIARWKFADLLERGNSFCFETVFSHESKIEMMSAAQEQGYQITLVYIHLISPELNELRVKQRMSEGGHWVPPGKIATRIERTQKLMQQAVQIADKAYLLDNSSSRDPFRQIAIKNDSGISVFVEPIPKWVSDILSL